MDNKKTYTDNQLVTMTLKAERVEKSLAWQATMSYP